MIHDDAPQFFHQIMGGVCSNGWIESTERYIPSIIRLQGTVLIYSYEHHIYGCKANRSWIDTIGSLFGLAEEEQVEPSADGGGGRDPRRGGERR
jgi:hypothetical protein